MFGVAENMPKDMCERCSESSFAEYTEKANLLSRFSGAFSKDAIFLERDHVLQIILGNNFLKS
ncbi:MAG: hypothetical protein Q8O64_05860 [Sideroxyarcus sp.]|nr:hypothetical protein [Sideroxyarcus sp.]